ncbi:MAG TPA: 6-phosphogluconolactonase [Candidatus Saccharimonadales bacterium]|nr:6-phosphogluconolactonase [Candidatus Saccharimonadales bacterium]
MKTDLLRFVSLEELSLAAAERVIEYANQAIKERGVFNVALAGGSTPRGLYDVLSSSGYQSKTDWSCWRIYFGDERLVPLTDSRSNYAMAKEHLLDNVPISGEHIYMPPVHLLDARNVAMKYERTIKGNFGNASSIPRLDLILLGLGSDGHTASLFPDMPALEVTDRLVTYSSPGVLPPPVERVTFTLPFINAARHILFLASGEDKPEAFKAAYYGTPLGLVKRVPASMVNPKDGDIRWLVTAELTT